MVSGLLFYSPASLTATIFSHISSSALLAILYFRGFSAMHEAVHSSLHSNKKMNNWFGVYYGALCFLPFEHWKDIHLQHHLWTGNWEKDPVMKLVRDFRGEPTRVTKVISFFWRSWIPALAIMQEYVFWFVCTTRFLQEKPFKISRFMSLAFPILTWASIFYFAGPNLTLSVFIPSFLIYLVMVEVINLPHHLGLPQNKGEVKMALWDQYLAARSCAYPWVLSHFVFLNFNYHAEHHLYPNLPWTQLAALSEKLRHELENYNLCIGNQWIQDNRRRAIEDVLKPGEMAQKEAKEA